jgi:hypothetical protein
MVLSLPSAKIPRERPSGARRDKRLRPFLEARSQTCANRPPPVGSRSHSCWPDLNTQPELVYARPATAQPKPLGKAPNC